MPRIPIGRLFTVLLALATVAAAAVVFNEKRESASAAAQVVRLKRAIAREQDRISALKAEWSLLDQPERLQGIVTKYNGVMNLQLLDPKQIGTLEDVPGKAPAGADPSVALAQPGAAVPPTASDLPDTGETVDEGPGAVTGGGNE